MRYQNPVVLLAGAAPGSIVGVVKSRKAPMVAPALTVVLSAASSSARVTGRVVRGASDSGPWQNVAAFDVSYGSPVDFGIQPANAAAVLKGVFWGVVVDSAVSVTGTDSISVTAEA